MILPPSTRYDHRINKAIDRAASSGWARFSSPDGKLGDEGFLIKYMPAHWGGMFPPGSRARGGMGLHVSSHPGFTWGDALYASTLAYPVTGAIYGRCGVVAKFEPTRPLRLFDATDLRSQTLYRSWIRSQPAYHLLTDTAHAHRANQLLRNLFRTRFRIDVVAFHPDEANARYTRRRRDRWLAISEWSPSWRLMGSCSSTLAVDARLCVLVGEEFASASHGMRRSALIGPVNSGKLTVPSANSIRAAWHASSVVSVDV